MTLPFLGTAIPDSIIGTNSNDQISSLAGNDTALGSGVIGGQSWVVQ